MISESNNEPFRIAIVGGGIGGLFCALAVHHHCSHAGANIKIDVYEQASQYKEIGAGVGLGINAARLVHKLDIGDKLNAVAGHRTGVWISFRRFDNSEEVVTIPVNDTQKVRQAPAARTDLLDLLRESVEERGAATLHVKKACQRVEVSQRTRHESHVTVETLTNIQDLGDIVRIHFADSTTAEANLVIACDGIHSAVRNQFVVDKPLFSGTIAYRGVIPIASLTEWPFPSYSVLWVAKHRHFLVFPISQNKSLNIVAFVTKGVDEVADVEESWTSICDRSDVEEDFAGFDKYVQEIISLMPEKPSKWKLNDRLPLDLWHYFDGKVMLLGDAAHAMLPHLGAGAGQSLEDGWVLGRAVSEYLTAPSNAHFASLSSTAQLYQDVRLPRAQKTQRTSRAAGDTYELQTEDMKDLTFEECLPLIAERTRERMKWVWEEDLDAAYEKMRDEKDNLVDNGVEKKAEMIANGTIVGKQAVGVQAQ